MLSPLALSKLISCSYSIKKIHFNQIKVNLDMQEENNFFIHTLI
jgi:hypothetical protein